MVQRDRLLTLSRLISISASTSRTIYPIGYLVVAAIVYPKIIIVVVGYILLLSVYTSDNIIILLYKHSPGPMEVVSQGHLPCVPRVVVYVCALTPRRRPGPRPHSLTHMRVRVYVCMCCVCVMRCAAARHTHTHIFTSLVCARRRVVFCPNV